MAASADLVGRRVTAKRAGWDEQLTPVQQLDMEPLDPAYAAEPLEGELAYTSARLPNGETCHVWTVGGQEADPKTVEPADAPAGNARPKSKPERKGKK